VRTGRKQQDSGKRQINPLEQITIEEINEHEKWQGADFMTKVDVSPKATYKIHEVKMECFQESWNLLEGKTMKVFIIASYFNPSYTFSASSHNIW